MKRLSNLLTFTITRYGAWAELCLAFGLGGFAWLNHRPLRNETKLVTAKVEETARSV